MIAAEELRLVDAKEASASSAYSKPEIDEIQEMGRPRGDLKIDGGGL